MIAFGCATTDELEFRKGAGAAIEAVAEPGSLLMRRQGWPSLDLPYNAMTAEAAARDDLEALALVHEDFAFAGTDFLARVRALLAADPEIAVIGTAPLGQPREVELIGGELIVLSAWACAELRFDPALAGSRDALAADVSLAARARGKRALAADLGAAATKFPPPSARRRQVRAGAALRRKWNLAPTTPPP